MILKHLHMTLAYISVLGFIARGLWRIGLGRPLASRGLRVTPHVIDTLLLATGVGLAVRLGIWPHHAPWFTTKLLLIAVYIGLGITALRARPQWLRWTLFIAATGTGCWIIAVAWTRSPLPGLT